ncbi:MAG: hypothetical protein ACOVOV_16115, partial [Dolichospermum sp.]
DNQIMLGGSNNGTYPQVVAPGGFQVLDPSSNSNSTQMSQSGLNTIISQGNTGGNIQFATRFFNTDPSNNNPIPNGTSITNLSLSSSNGTTISSCYPNSTLINFAKYNSNTPNKAGGIPLIVQGASDASYNGTMYFVPYAFAGQYNGMVELGDSAIIVPTTKNNSVLTLTTWSDKYFNGLRITGNSTTLAAGSTGTASANASVVCDGTNDSVTLSANANGNHKLILSGTNDSTDVLILQNTDATHQIVMSPSIGSLYNPLFQGNDNAISSGSSNATTVYPLTVGVKSTTTNGLRVTSTSTMLGAGGGNTLPSTYIKSDGSSNTIVGQTIINNTLAIGKTSVASNSTLDVSGNANIAGSMTVNGVSMFKNTAEFIATDIRLLDASNNFTQMYQSGLYASITQGFTGGTIGFYTKDPSNSIIDPSINNIANLTLSTTNGSVLKSKYGQNFTATYDSNYPPTSSGGYPFVISGAGSYGGELLFIPYATQGAWNGLSSNSDCAIIAIGNTPTGAANADNYSTLTLSVWSDTTTGVRITSNTTKMVAGSASIVCDSTSGSSVTLDAS